MITAIAVLPARLESTRLPRKPLVDLAGQPILRHVWRQAMEARCFTDVVVATDAHEIVDVVETWGGKAILTERGFRNGTERIASIAPRLDAEFVVNVQADMPRIDSRIFHQLLRALAEQEASVITPVYGLSTPQELRDPNVVKAIRAVDGRAMYFSRQPIPYRRETPQDLWLESGSYWGHVGVYGMTSSILRHYASEPPGTLELAEDLEQLRFLEIGIPIMTEEVQVAPLRIDSVDDLSRARRLIARAIE